jgi:hypothetical protein
MSLHKTVLGMDKLPSYSGFFIAVLGEGGFILKREAQSIEEVAEIARSGKVDSVAVDNINEIGSEREIRRFITLLNGIELVQVTGAPSEGFKPLSVIAKELGASSGEKLRPLRSAEVCAQAVMAGVGYLVRVYDPETRITISRRRKFGSGGMSEGRYRRSIQGSVLTLTNSIKSLLNSRSIDFDLGLRKGSHGIEGASFIVYATRDKLFGIVRPLRTSSIAVRVTPTFTKSFEFVNMAPSEEGPPKRYLIVGVDPGMVTGVAVMALNGRVMLATSGRGITRGQITRMVAEFGRALIFATDVRPPPMTLSKLSATHNAILFVPEKDLKTSEKKELVERILEGQKPGVEDSHQRDALAAAAKAYSFYRNKLEQVVAHVRNEDRTVQIDEVKANVLRGMSIRDAIALSKVPVFEEAVPKHRGGSESGLIRVLKTKADDLRLQRDRLIAQKTELENEVDNLRNELRLARYSVKSGKPREPETYELDRRIRSLQDENTQLRAQLGIAKFESARVRGSIENLATGKSLLLVCFKNVEEAVCNPRGPGWEGIAFIERMGELSDDLLRELRTSDISAFVMGEDVPGERRQLMSLGFPVARLSSISFEAYPTVLVADRASLTRSIEDSRKEMRELPEVKAKKIKDMLDEYRRGRMNEAL